ncbi:ExbD/TolR family protein [Neisseria sp. CCUG17229]|uniref:Biopolymer transporter ExbD n=1 Tax=Neisseria brasiliensis TaxID=2666100 RepID=A0A5Q3RZH5_9NEIS|nr:MULTISPECIES: biopolymer transporter ExbD [Neisseria]MRN38402.1 biopolymer transporter ExbD [Neisseria brasiliensis]PJO10192.1 biopolymer transporter ExbD [Neisseria sp. N95_16]PJO78663.1 biopolymer transporter ExbD [Neisseria sp. N177_16]QGL25400.1 biopolymer transporter ExbD [Neisseria brasiliensis]
MAFGSMNSGDEDAPMSDINVTPLVDVMLVLLIVFMITMPVLTHSIPLELPTASEQAAKKDTQPKEPLRVTIGSDGAYYIGGDSDKKITIEEVTARLKEAKTANEDAIVAIAADKAVEYDYVNKALGAAREAGISKIGFVTETKAE